MATYDDVEEWIREENGGGESVDDQVVVEDWFWNNRVTVIKGRSARTSEAEGHVGDRLDHKVRGCLDNLVEIGVLVRLDPPGTGRYIRHHRSEQNFFDPNPREFVPLLDEDLSRLLEDLHSRTKQQKLVANGGTEETEEEEQAEDDEDEKNTSTLQSIIADALNVDESQVKQELTEPGDPFERMNRYDTAVNAIKASDDVQRRLDYDEMGWRNMAIQWSLSERAAHMEANHSITG